MGESATDGAVREVREEIGFDCARFIVPTVYAEQAYTYVGRLNTDRWQTHGAFPDEARRPCCVFHKRVVYFLAVCDAPAPLLAQEAEVALAEWVPLSEVGARVAANRDGDAAAAALFQDFWSREDVQLRLQS